METLVVNIEEEECDVYIGRGKDIPTHMLARDIKPGVEGWLGNPHPVGWCDICLDYHTREESIDKFKLNFEKKLSFDENFKNGVLALKGKRLGCNCKPENCHGDIIKEWVDSNQ